MAALPTLEIGPYRFTAPRARDFRLDGGAMFGVGPRVLWSRLEPPDPTDNTVPIATRPLLIEGAPYGPIVVEPGLGGDFSAKGKAIYRVDDASTVVASLAARGLQPDDVRVVVLTHLHWDHAGAAVTGEDDRAVPQFPNARHVVPQIEVDACLAGDSVRRASYRASVARALLDRDLVDAFTEAIRVVAPGIAMHGLGGHSEGVCVVTVESGGRTLCFWADVVPTRNHVNPFYVMAYDLDAGASYAVRRPWIERAAREAWINALYHDPVAPFW